MTKVERLIGRLKANVTQLLAASVWEFTYDGAAQHVDIADG